MKSGMKIAIALAGVVAITGAAFAQADAIKSRQEAMKAIGGGMGALVKMVKGEEPFDAAKAKGAVETIAAKAKGFDALFPKGSETGGETAAAPAIWSDMGGFKAALAKLETTAAAQAGSVTNLDGVKAAVGALGGACKNCHDTYRLKKS